MSRRERRANDARGERLGRRREELDAVLPTIQAPEAFAALMDRHIDVLAGVVRAMGAKAPTVAYVRQMNDQLQCFDATWVENACRWKWRGVTPDTASEVFVTEVARRCRDRSVRALTDRGVPRAAAESAVVGQSIDALRAALKVEVMRLTGAAPEGPGVALDRLAVHVVVTANEQNLDDLTKVADQAETTLRRAVTPALREALIKTGWKNVTTENVDEALRVAVTNRAAVNLACLLVHAVADKHAIEGLAEGREPREIGLANTYYLSEAGGMETVRATLAAACWRGADGEEDVDMRFGRLVTERALAISQGDRGFAHAPTLKLMSTVDRGTSEKAFRARYVADYEQMKSYVASHDGYMVPGQKAPFVAIRMHANPTWLALDKIVTGPLKRHTHEIAAMYPEGLPKEDGDLDRIAQHLKIEGDYLRMRPLLVKARWRGVTEATVDEAISKMYLVAARTFQDPDAEPTRPRRTHDGELRIYDRADIQADSHESNEAMVRHCLAVDAGWEARTKPVAQARSPAPAAKPLSWSTPKGFDDYLTAIGVRFWNETYREGMSDEAARAHIVAAADNTLNAPPEHPARMESAALANFAAKWAVHAFQRVQTSHTFAAAMMATTTHPECADDLEVPWAAFMVHVPNGMLVVDASEYSRLLVVSYDSGAELHMVAASAPDGGAVALTAPTLAALLLDEPEAKTSIERAALVARRLITGLLFAMQAKDNRKEKVVRASRSFRDGRRHEEPEHRIVVVGHPLTVDCREAITSYVQTGRYERVTSDGGSDVRRGPPIVQVLVRGHRKQQVCGVGRLGRKTIFVESYWRGPKDAPILTKPKRIVGKPG